MTRTQICLDEALKKEAQELSDREGVSMAETIRRALTAFLHDKSRTSDRALNETFGLWVDRPAGECDSRKLRNEWKTRQERRHVS